MNTTIGDRDVVAGMATERLEAELTSTAATLAGRTFDLLVLIGEYDHRDAHLAWGHLSCVAWLADLCDIERSHRGELRARRPRHAPIRACWNRRCATVTCRMRKRVCSPGT